jgi:CD80-like C2-set immunoglobulin domain
LILFQLITAFSTVSSEMEVVDVPKNKPVITEIKSHYRMTEVIRGNCTSQYSRPASNLTWLINDKPAAVSFADNPIVPRSINRKQIFLLLSFFLLLETDCSNDKTIPICER